jgi:hypothetical protein
MWLEGTYCRNNVQILPPYQIYDQGQIGIGMRMGLLRSGMRMSLLHSEFADNPGGRKRFIALLYCIDRALRKMICSLECVDERLKYDNSGLEGKPY